MAPFDQRPLNSAPASIRIDLRLIAGMIEDDVRLLDVGCGDGQLLEHLTRTRRIVGRGIELSQEGVNSCVARGLSVIQGDADTDLAYYPSDAFDYVILSQTLQATRSPRLVLTELVRIGRRAIVSFPNFGHWRIRLSLLLLGRMPGSEVLPHPWWNTPNIHLCTVRDFLALTEECDFTVERSLVIDRRGHAKDAPGLWRANLFGQQAIFLLSKHR